MTHLVFCTLLGPEGPGRHLGVERILWTLLCLTLESAHGVPPVF
jgi:hypothetical protein